MNAPPRLFREWAACFGMALSLAALVLWSSAGGGGRLMLALAGSGALIVLGIRLERRSEALRNFGRIVMAGGLAGLFGIICAAGRHPLLLSERWAWLVSVFLLAVGALTAWLVDRRQSPWLGAVTLGLACFASALQPFTGHGLFAHFILAALAARWLGQRQWTAPAWTILAGIHLAFLIWWPFPDGRLDADRSLELPAFITALLAFSATWALFAWSSLRAADGAFRPGRRLAFATLNNALCYGLGVLCLPPRHPDWHWKFTLLFGLVLLAASTMAGRFADLRRGYLVQGCLLAVLGLVSAVTGHEPATMLAVASAFFVLTVSTRDDGLLRPGAYFTALLAVAFAWMPVRENVATGLRLGVLTGAVLVFEAVWISRRRELWERWAVAAFTALGLGLWLLTTFTHAPEVHRAPVLALAAVLLTASFATLAVREIPWLGKAFVLAAQIVWFMQLGALVRPWWNPVIVVLATLAISAWWQTRGRALIPEWELRWVQGVAAAASVAIVLLWVEGSIGTLPAGLVVMPLLALGSLRFGLKLGDWFLVGFGQLFTATAVGEFIGQLSHAPVPGPLAALAPIVVLPVMAPILRARFQNTEWATTTRWLALLYRLIAAVMFVVWVMHYLPADYRFIALALAGMVLLLVCVVAQPRGPLLESMVCDTGALVVFWVGWIGGHGFRLLDLAAFILLLGYGVIGRRTRLLPTIVQEIGIVLGLGSVTHWVSLWVAHHFPALPLAAVWAVVAVIILAVGWWLREWLYRAVAWTLLAAALGRLFYVDLHSAPAFRLGLLAVGASAIVAAFTYFRRPAPAGE